MCLPWKRHSWLQATLVKLRSPLFGKELILPATKDICHEHFGEDDVKMVANVLLSATIITRRIDEIADDVKVQLLDRINDADNEAILLVFFFVLYIFQEDVHGDLLYALFLSTNFTAVELFKSLNDYISGRLNWSFCVGICTDGEAAIIGRLSGLTTRIKAVAFKFESTHNIIYKEMLAIWKLSLELNSVLPDMIKVTNHIKVHALNSRLWRDECRINAFSCIQKLDGFHWLKFLSYESPCRDLV